MIRTPAPPRSRQVFQLLSRPRVERDAVEGGESGQAASCLVGCDLPASAALDELGRAGDLRLVEWSAANNAASCERHRCRRPTPRDRERLLVLAEVAPGGLARGAGVSPDAEQVVDGLEGQPQLDAVVRSAVTSGRGAPARMHRVRQRSRGGRRSCRLHRETALDVHPGERFEGHVERLTCDHVRRGVGQAEGGKAGVLGWPRCQHDVLSEGQEASPAMIPGRRRRAPRPWGGAGAPDHSRSRRREVGRSCARARRDRSGHTGLRRRAHSSADKTPERADAFSSDGAPRSRAGRARRGGRGGTRRAPHLR